MTQGPIVNNIVYKDFDILFNKHPVTRKLNTLTNNAAIARSVKNLILTNKGERPFKKQEMLMMLSLKVKDLINLFLDVMLDHNYLNLIMEHLNLN